MVKDASTLQEANDKTFLPGDIIEIQGKVIGNLTLTESGAPGKPIIIRGGQLSRVDLYNNGHITVKDITLVDNDTSVLGISIYQDDNKRYSDILIENVTASGYSYAGIYVSMVWESMEQATNYTGGYDRIVIRNCTTYDNDYAGIAVYGSWPGIQHRDISIINCKAYDARGIKGLRPHSGHGILLAGVDKGLIDSCQAWNNGWQYGHGNIGIWTHDARNVVIQNSRSTANISTTGIDGGGFDIDGGAVDCTIRNCYSENNNGAGYLLYEYGSENPMGGNSFINNISVNDGNKNAAYSAFTLGGNVPIPGSITVQGNKVQLLPGKQPITYSGHRPTNISITNNSWQ